MGWGDEIIVTAQARARQARDPRPVLVVDYRGRPRWSEIWCHNPRIVSGAYGRDCQTLVNGPGVRPYIEGKAPTRWVWKQFKCEPGEIYLTNGERASAERWRGCVLVEPNNKPKPESVNKAWVWDRWQALVNLRIARMIQAGPPGVPLLRDVEHAETASFRLACAVLSVCRAYVGTEGGLHHAAAALGIPSVVLFGGFISPDVTGYQEHRNLYAGGTACGSRLPCLHCREAMAAIEVETVAENLRAILK